MAVGLLALNGNAVLRLLNDIFCHYFLFCHSLSFSELWQAIVILCHSQNRQLRVRKFNAERVALSSEIKKVAECCYFKADKVRSAEHTLAYVSNSESASLTQKELHYPTFFSIFVVEYSGQGEIPYRR